MIGKIARGAKAADTYRMMKLIEENGRVIDGYWSYDEGWSDERVAKTFGMHVVTVRTRRTAAFGNLKKGGGEHLSRVWQYEKRLAAIEDRVAVLEDLLTAKPARHEANGLLQRP